MSLTSKLAEKLDSEKTFKFSEVDNFSEERAWIGTGAPMLDYNLRTHGYPTGIIEVRGPSQSGKTTLSLHAIKQCKAQYGDRAVIVILSSERRDNKEYAKMLGLPIDDVLVTRVKTVEDVFNNIGRTIIAALELFKEEGIKEKPRFLFVWDSLGQTVSAQEKTALTVRRENKLKGDDEKQAALGSAARAVSLGLRGFVAVTDEQDATLMIINRAYDNIGGAGKTSYGGKAITFYPTMRFDLYKKEGLKVGDDELGQITVVKAFKTDFDRPNRSHEIEIGYGYGIVLSKQDIEKGIKFGILKKFGQHGASFMNGKLKWETRRSLYQLYEDRNPLLKVVTNKIAKKLHAKVTKERKARLEDD